MEEDISVEGSLKITVSIENNGTFELNAGDQITITKQWFPEPHVTGDGSFDVSGGTLAFQDCTLDTDNTATWTLTGGTIHVTSDCDCGGESYDYTACDIDVQAGTLEVDNTFKTNGDVDLSGGTLQVDEQFTGKGELDFSGGTIKVAAGKIAAFTPND